MTSANTLKSILSELKLHDKNQAERINEVINALEVANTTLPKKDTSFLLLCLVYSLIKQNPELLKQPNVQKLNSLCIEIMKNEISDLFKGMSHPDPRVLLESDFKNSTQMILLMNFMLETQKKEKFIGNKQLHHIFHAAHEAIMGEHQAAQETPYQHHKNVDGKRTRC